MFAVPCVRLFVVYQTLWNTTFLGILLLLLLLMLLLLLLVIIFITSYFYCYY